MNEPTSAPRNEPELHGELKDAVEATLREPPPADVRRRVLDRAAAWTPTEPHVGSTPKPSRRRVLLVAGTVAAVVAAGWTLVLLDQFPLGRIADAVTAVYNGSRTGPQKEQPVPDQTQERRVRSANGSIPNPGATAAYYIPNLPVAIAERAPVIASVGPPTQKIKLGERVPRRESGDTLHIWNWSERVQSRALEITVSRPFALSPDGKTLVTHEGRAWDLTSGEVTAINEVEGQVADVTFSPDGGILALLTMIEGRGDRLRLLHFPSGAVRCEFPAGEPYTLRIAFSPDGKQLYAADPNRQILRRDTATGNIRKRYGPPLDRQVLAIAVSPNNRYIAASQREGDLFIWKAESGDLLRRVEIADYDRLTSFANIDCLAFSHDGTMLAAADSSRVTIYETATGKQLQRLDQSIAKAIRWSDDGETITVIKTPAIQDARGQLNFGTGVKDIYPSVHIWDWRDGRLLRSLDASR